jgi:cellulose synthase/poly-beta-1,6-N-acetylglucosamine synthase-like glycosyltransferase
MSACISEPRSFYNDTHQAAWKHRQRALRGKILPSTMPKPSISILIGTLNVERFIAEAVRRVLAQDYPADRREILVVDDGSTDGTQKMLQRFEPAIRISPKPTEGRRGLSMLELRISGARLSPFLTGTAGGHPIRFRVSPRRSKRIPVLVSLPTASRKCLPTGHSVANSFVMRRNFALILWQERRIFGCTGVRVVMNTTFNLRDEAIVHTPTDAIRTFFSSGMDARVVGSFLVEK